MQARGGTSGASDQHGFTLLEVLVAVGIFAVMALGLAQLLGVAIRATQIARSRTATALLASQKIEQLRALAWEVHADGARVSDTTSDLSRDPPIASGWGLQPTASSTLSGNVSGYVDFVDAGGRWVGTGTTVPAGTAYVRRWAVLAPSDDPDDTRVFVVRAMPIADVLRQPTPARSPEETVLVAIRTRQVVP
jgi:prepilin-type N-terminal cleavage/methylation domain-containing protein